MLVDSQPAWARLATVASSSANARPVISRLDSDIRSDFRKTVVENSSLSYNLCLFQTCELSLKLGQWLKRQGPGIV